MTAITAARTVTEANAAFKDVVNQAFVDAGGPWPMPAAARAASEELRQWHIRQIGNFGSRVVDHDADGTPILVPRMKVVRTPLHERLAHPNEDGTITCTGPCGETKPANKFPTTKGGIGRESRCRACRDNKGADNGS